MKVGVIGSGTMGSGICQVFAQSGNNVILCSSSIESANRGRAKIEKGLNSRVSKGKMTQEAADAILANISTGVLEDLADRELIVEGIKEELNTKRELFAKLTNICSEDCLFASNTSALSITALAAGIKQEFIGIHFFNPATAMKLIEIIPGLNTSDAAVEKAVAIAESLGKSPVVVKESAGFVVNRILIPMINEAIGLYAEGIASVEGIDTAMKFGANHPMGPLALGDLIGLDVCLAIMETLQSETGDPKYRPHPMLRKMVRGGRLGMKSGRGFYDYNK